MIRRYVVPPDESGFISRDAMYESMAQLAAVLDFAGGSATVVTQRERVFDGDGQELTLEGERATTAVIIQWNSHPKNTDVAPESEASLATAPAPGAPVEPEVAETPAQEAPETPAGTVADGVGDGLDPATLDEEDVSEIPVSA